MNLVECSKEADVREVDQDGVAFVWYDRLKQVHVGREGEAVTLRVGRRRLTFPARAIPALVKMLAEVLAD